MSSDFTRRALIATGAASLAAPALAQQQTVDPAFTPKVDRPAITGGPRLILDEAHRNYHTAAGQYAPFARLMTLDGWRVEAGRAPFAPSSLDGVRLLVIANAGHEHDGPAGQTFTPDECNAVEQWVRKGGALWLIADHAPFGRAAQPLAAVFGFRMGEGWAYEPAATGVTTQFVFSSANGRLGDHPILRGRREAEKIGLVRSFTGQSLTLPTGAVPLLRLDSLAREAADMAGLTAAAKAVADGKPPGDPPVADRAQGFALEHGAGRLVVLGEAGMLSAQRVVHADGGEMRFGMNVAGYDNQQFALNCARWLARVL